jgi:hypothetical protein
MSDRRRKSLKPTTAGGPARSVAKRTEYVPTDADRAAARACRERAKGKPQLAGSTVELNSDSRTIGWDHVDEFIGTLHLANALATDDFTFARGLHIQLANSLGTALNARKLDATLAIVRGIAPRDPTEALLATQMAMTHNAAAQAAGYLANAEFLPQQESASTMFNKLMRTFAMQLEALKKYRSAGEQVVRVEHVTVQNGGQAIVGNVQAGGGGYGKNASQPLELGASQATSEAHAPSPALPCDVQTNGNALPSPGDKGTPCVPLPRGQGRRSAGNGKRRMASRAAH